MAEATKAEIEAAWVAERMREIARDILEDLHSRIREETPKQLKELVDAHPKLIDLDRAVLENVFRAGAGLAMSVMACNAAEQEAIERRVCRVCKCTQERGCDPSPADLGDVGPCWWHDVDLCSHCACRLGIIKDAKIPF